MEIIIQEIYLRIYVKGDIFKEGYYNSGDKFII